MKRILIFEDNEDDWATLHGWLALHYQMFPKNNNDFYNLRGDLATLYQKGIEESYIKATKRKIVSTLAKHKPDLCIVDYELMESNQFCTGKALVKDFMTNQKILMMTGIKGGEMHHIINDLMDFSKKGDNGNTIEFLLKEDMGSLTFQNRFMLKIEEMLGPVNESPERFDVQKLKSKSNKTKDE